MKDDFNNLITYINNLDWEVTKESNSIYSIQNNKYKGNSFGIICHSYNVFEFIHSLNLTVNNCNSIEGINEEIITQLQNLLKSLTNKYVLDM